MQGISPDVFFAGVCCGGLITLPIQVGIVLFYIDNNTCMEIFGLKSSNFLSLIHHYP